jgi:hypothetical protein
MVDALEGMLRDLMIYRDRETAKKEVIAPEIRWQGT